MNRPKRSSLRANWALNPETTILNHGSFGACPLPVLREQDRLRALMEHDPTEFFFVHNPPLWSEALSALSAFVNADPVGMTFQTSATTGLATVLASQELQPGDEILLADHAYAACSNSIDRVCRDAKARVVLVPVPFWVEDQAEILDLFLRAVTPKTRLALIDTVTSPTATRMPFEELTAMLQGKGVDVIIDAAHGPGLLPLDLNALGAAYVVGNCHKWLYTPKGSGFLHIRSDKRQDIEPLVTSHGYSARAPGRDTFRDEFDWQGTQDTTPWLCIPKAIEVIGAMKPGGWPEVMEHNHSLALYVRDQMISLVGENNVTAAAATTAMVTVKLPAVILKDGQSIFDRDPLMQVLLEENHIHAIVFAWPPHDARYLRISTPLYVSRSELDYFAGVLEHHL